MKTYADLRTEILAGFTKLKADVAAIVPAGVIVPRHHCGLCGKPASLIVGRNSRREFIVPVQCGHFPHPVDVDPVAFILKPETETLVNRLINDADYWITQCLPPPKAQALREAGEQRAPSRSERADAQRRAAYRQARRGGRSLARVG